MTKSLVFDDSRMTHSLVFCEDAIGKQMPSPAHLKRSIREVIELDVLTGEFFRHLIAFQNHLFPIVRQG